MRLNWTLYVGQDTFSSESLLWDWWSINSVMDPVAVLRKAVFAGRSNIFHYTDYQVLRTIKCCYCSIKPAVAACHWNLYLSSTSRVSALIIRAKSHNENISITWSFLIFWKEKMSFVICWLFLFNGALLLAYADELQNWRVSIHFLITLILYHFHLKRK